MMNKKTMFSILMAGVLTYSAYAQYELEDAQLHITNLSMDAFTEGTNEFSSGSANKVKLTYGTKGESNTFTISPANVVTCDGMTGNYIANLSFSNINRNEYAWIQIENTGTSNITHVAFRGWYNTSNAHMLTFGYSMTNDEESEFTTIKDQYGFEDAPLVFDTYCDMARTAFENLTWLPVEGATYIRLTSSPSFPNIGFDLFSGNANVAVYGIYILTDDQGIPSSILTGNEETFKVTRQGNIWYFSEKAENIILYDTSGRIIRREGHIEYFSIQDINPGIYILRATNPKGEKITKKIKR